MTRRHNLITAITALLIAAMALPAGADTPPKDTAAAPPTSTKRNEPRVLLLVTDAKTGLVTRLRAELASLGFGLVMSTVERTAPSRRRLEQAARGEQAIAALLVMPSAKGVEVWISDRVTGKTVLREVISPAAGPKGERDVVIALRAVELLRASLLETSSSLPHRGEITPSTAVKSAAGTALPAPSPAAPPLQPSPSPAAPPQQPSPSPAALPMPAPAPAAESPQVWIGLSPGISWAGGAFPTPYATLHAGGRVHRWVALEGAFVAPLYPLRIEDEAGRANLMAYHAIFDADATLLPPASPFTLAAGAGIALSWLPLDGTLTTDNSAIRNDFITTWPHVHVAAGWAPIRRLRLDLAGRVGVTLPEPVIEFSGKEILRYGSPIMLFSLGASIGL